MDYEKLRVLNQLKDEGSISEEEYQRQREKLSRESELSSKSEFDDLRKLTEDEKTYAFFYAPVSVRYFYSSTNRITSPHDYVDNEARRSLYRCSR